MEIVEIKSEIERYIGGGSMSSAARRMGVTPSYLSRVVNGIKPPSDTILRAIGVRVVYERVQPVTSRIDETMESAGD